jgi:hypothetical protein
MRKPSKEHLWVQRTPQRAKGHHTITTLAPLLGHCSMHTCFLKTTLVAYSPLRHPSCLPKNTPAELGLGMQPACEGAVANCGVRADRACCADGTTYPVAQPQADTACRNATKTVAHTCHTCPHTKAPRIKAPGEPNVKTHRDNTRCLPPQTCGMEYCRTQQPHSRDRPQRTTRPNSQAQAHIAQCRFSIA